MPPKRNRKKKDSQTEDASLAAGPSVCTNPQPQQQNPNTQRQQEHQGYQQRQPNPNVQQQQQQQRPHSQPALQGKQSTSSTPPGRPMSQPTSQQKQTVEKAADIQEQLSSMSLQGSTSSLSSSSSPSKEPVQKLKVSKMQQQMQVLQIPKRKGTGTVGRPIEVETNMLPMIFGKNFPTSAIHYDVDIVPNVPKYLMRPVFLKFKSMKFPNRNPAFDGKKNAFSASPLFKEEVLTDEVIVFNEDNKERTFKVTMKKVANVDLSWLRNVKPGVDEKEQMSLQVLDVVLRNASAVNSHAIVGRSFFTPPRGRVYSLGGGMDLWVGLFQSAVLGWKPFLNIDVAHKGFPKTQPVIDLMKTICGVNEGDNGGGDARGQNYGRGGRGGGRGGRGGGSQYDRGGRAAPTELTADLIQQCRQEITSFLKGLKVVVELPGQATSRRTYRVNDLVKCPQEDFFEHNGRKISVESYYRHEKKYTIRYPRLQCLWVGPRDKLIHVPPELCKIVEGQATQKKLNEEQTSSMIKFAATGTTERKQKIIDAFSSMKHNRDPCMNEFGLSLGEKFERVPARVLPPPKLLYQNQSASVSKGVWRTDRMKFLTPCNAIQNDNSWTILNLNYRTDEGQLRDLAQKLRITGEKLGIRFGNPETPFVNLRANNINDLVKYFHQKKEKKLQLIIVIVPEAKESYSYVKQSSELSVGILTQCIKSKTLFKLSDATLGNILLKINAKLNGTNHSLEPGASRPLCLKEPCMIVGADVTHPSPDLTDIPSIAAVTASHDPNAFMYNVEIRLQPARQEIIEDLENIMVQQLKFFYQKTHHKPKRIIVFRDGVSEGQFGQIMSAEVQAIRKACKRLTPDGSYQPSITFLVVQKRHHIRLFPTKPENSDDRNFNVQAGTIVDSHITHPTYIDFYLVSHASIQGTARPTKYCCLWDDSNFSEDEIEKLTYFLCHMFSRCNRSVSYPTPTYYAHLAAFRARALTQGVAINMNNLDQEQRVKMNIKDEVLKGKPMFFV